MGFTGIEIRTETYMALMEMRDKAFNYQKGVALDLSLSDVIDTLLEIATETDKILQDEVLEAIAITAERKT